MIDFSNLNIGELVTVYWSNSYRYGTISVKDAHSLSAKEDNDFLTIGFVAGVSDHSILLAQNRNGEVFDNVYKIPKNVIQKLSLCKEIEPVMNA
jgi:hypothetical protein